jgi:uncharacterized membrane protein YecN with MAPEG domain
MPQNIPVPTVAAFYGALAALLSTALAINVTRLRGQERRSVGEEGSPSLTRAIRAHGNNAEYTALAVALLVLAELCGGGSLILHLLGGGFVTGRLMHAHGMLTRTEATCLGGAIVSWLCIGALAVCLLLLRAA